MGKKKIYKVGEYVRLSKADLDRDGMAKSESDSVTNQRLLIERFIKEQPDMKLCGVYIEM